MSKQKRNRRLAAKLGVIAGAAVGGTDRAEAEIVRAFPFATSPSATLRPPANTLPAPTCHRLHPLGYRWRWNG
jgi:hypothetical protein